MTIKQSLTLAVTLSLLGCAANAETNTYKNPNDPYENLNRHTYHLNKGLDRVVLKPLATVYHTITPWPLEKGIHNFYNNLDEIPTIANSFIQGNLKQVISDLWRFSINSTIGLLGFIDVASRIGLPKHNNDFGLTLARMGYKSSAYLILPLYGPRTVRDIIGMPVDQFVFSVYPYVSNVPLRNSVYGFSFIDARASLITAEKVMQAAALDEYQFQRDTYLQWRNRKIKENTPGWSEEKELAEDELNDEQVDQQHGQVAP